MSYTCQIKNGKRFYYYQGRRIAKGKIPQDILFTIQCTTGQRGAQSTVEPNIARLLAAPKELQIQLLLYLPTYDIIRLSFVVPQLAWIRGCDRSAYDLWREIGRKLGVDTFLLATLNYPMSVLDVESTEPSTFTMYQPDRLRTAELAEAFLEIAAKKVNAYKNGAYSWRKSIYMQLLRMLVLGYSMGKYEFSNGLRNILENVGGEAMYLRLGGGRYQ